MSEFYTSIERMGNRVLYRGYRDGSPVEEEIKYSPHLFIPSNEKTEYRPFADKTKFLQKKTFDTIDAFREYTEQFKEV
jgi:hypothetical protein